MSAHLGHTHTSIWLRRLHPSNIMLEFVFFGWGSVLIHIFIFPWLAISACLVFGFLARPYAVDGLTFEYEVRFLFNHIGMILASLIVVALIFLSLARTSDFSRSYTLTDLTLLPLYIVFYFFADETSYYFMHVLIRSLVWIIFGTLC